MKILECTHCGSSELREQQGVIICAYCQSRFVPDASDMAAPSTVIGLDSDIQRLLQKCREDPGNRRRYAGLVLDLDPTNTEAHQYLR